MAKNRKLNYCPGCGKKLKKDDNAQMPYSSTGGKTEGYDVHCEHCDWSGNIEPDSLDTGTREGAKLKEKA